MIKMQILSKLEIFHEILHNIFVMCRGCCPFLGFLCAFLALFCVFTEFF